MTTSTKSDFIAINSATFVRVTNGTPAYPLNDHLGTPLMVANQNGTILAGQTFNYTPYGETYASNDPGTEDQQGFTGHIEDETGLTYMQARYYDPTIGRFLQTDPMGYLDQLNLYAYVANDPINYTDPFGTCTIDRDGRPISGLCAAIGDAAAQQILDEKMSDPDSLVPALDKILEDEGLLATISVDPEAESHTLKTPPIDEEGNVALSDVVSTTRPSGSTIVIGSPNEIEVRYADGSLGTENTLQTDTVEHEASHALDYAQGIDNYAGGPVFINAAPGLPKMVTPGEGRAVNRTNDYRNAKGRGYERIKY